jgi:hypothetical protein
VKADQLPVEPPDLLTWAEGVIPALVLYFANRNVELPARRRIVPGQLQLDSWDCEQVSVGFAGITDPGRQGTTSGAPRTGTPFSALKRRQVAYGIQIVRCAGSCNQPTFGTDNDEYGEVGKQMLVDAALLSQFMVDMASAPPDWHPKEINADAGDVVPIGPEGRMYALEASVIFDLMARTAAG